MRELQQKIGSVIEDSSASSYATTVQDISRSASTAGIADTISRGDHVHFMTAGIGAKEAKVAFASYVNSNSGPALVVINAVTATGCGEFSYLLIGGAETCRAGHPLTGTQNSSYIGNLVGMVAPNQSVKLTSTTNCTAVNWFTYYL